MPAALLALLGNLLPDVLKRVLPAEKISQAEAAQIAQAMQLELMKADWQKVEAEYKDRDSARILAGAEIAKSNAFTSALAALVRPLWGLLTLALFIWYGMHPSMVMPEYVHELIQWTLSFYFGGRAIEKTIGTFMDSKK